MWVGDFVAPMDHDGMPNNQEIETGMNANSSFEIIGEHPNIDIRFCKALYQNLTDNFNESGEKYCNVTTDSILCWPPTAANQTVSLKCFSKLFGVYYDDTNNATRNCSADGIWSKVDYTQCHEIKTDIEEVETQANIYFVGYSISFVTLLIAVGIFTYFKELRCLRNIIHMNLMWSYMMFYALWIIILVVINNGVHMSTSCIFISTLLNYSYLSTFFWMFVEGLYLYILVVETLTRESFKLRIYVCIGWGMPLGFIIVWAVSITFATSGGNVCPLSEVTKVDWIYQAPIAVVLVLNMLFLGAIMWVLITKLRAANTAETQHYHKAARALLVLMPLLGITYVITIWYPTAEHNVPFERIRAFLLSIQGFTVALFYCFLNTEVKNSIRHNFQNWQASRSLGPSRNRAGSRSRDWSPRSRTESIRLSHLDENGPKHANNTNHRHNDVNKVSRKNLRNTEWTLVSTEDVPEMEERKIDHTSSNGLYSQPTNLYHKRESCASEVTTTTLVTVNGGSSRPSNGSAQARSPFLHPSRPGYSGNV